MSSRRPTNGLTKYAPTLAAISACAAENTSVTLTRVPSSVSVLHARTPACVNGTLTTMCSEILRSSRPSRSMPSYVGGHDLAADGAMDDVADLLEDVAGVPRLLRHQRGIGGDAVDDAEGVQPLDVGDVAGVDEEFHETLPPERPGSESRPCHRSASVPRQPGCEGRRCPAHARRTRRRPAAGRCPRACRSTRCRPAAAS